MLELGSIDGTSVRIGIRFVFCEFIVNLKFQFQVYLVVFLSVKFWHILSSDHFVFSILSLRRDLEIVSRYNCSRLKGLRWSLEILRKDTRKFIKTEDVVNLYLRS